MNWNWVRFGVLFPAVCFFGQAPVLRADIFEIRGGGTISGTLLNDPKSPVLQIRTNDGVEIEIPSGKLKQPVTVSPEIEAIYKKMAGKEDTPELHRALALELKNGPLIYAHRERVVELEPTDSNWAALGGHAPNKQTGEWERKDVLEKRKGLVLSQANTWDTPQSQAILKNKSAEKLASAEMAKLFNQHLKNLDSKTPKLNSAATEFFSLLGNSEAFYQKYQLNHRLAIKVISDLLLPKADAPQAASPAFLMDLLIKMPDYLTYSVFVEIAMESPNSQLQQEALELLNRTDLSREYAFMRFWNELLSASTRDKEYIPKIDRAGSNLQGFADKRAIPILIDRLLSKVTTTVKTQGSQSFNRDGSGGGMSTGGEKKIENFYQHQTILNALVGIAEGESYNYDQQAWRLWYARKYAKTNMDLRRDE
ncbi:MAG: hypothetical protein NTY15_12570 [Planctomycetota bacterium]|nr:hypothetical protein [Planctomycetota bacterium]